MEKIIIVGKIEGCRKGERPNIRWINSIKNRVYKS